MPDWKLIRCIYDYMGMSCNEVEDPEKFDKGVRKGASVSWCIVTLVVSWGKEIARVELEGSKENLEYVLKMIRGENAG